MYEIKEKYRQNGKRFALCKIKMHICNALYQIIFVCQCGGGRNHHCE